MLFLLTLLFIELSFANNNYESMFQATTEGAIEEETIDGSTYHLFYNKTWIGVFDYNDNCIYSKHCDSGCIGTLLPSKTYFLVYDYGSKNFTKIHYTCPKDNKAEETINKMDLKDPIFMRYTNTENYFILATKSGNDIRIITFTSDLETEISRVSVQGQFKYVNCDSGSNSCVLGTTETIASFYQDTSNEKHINLPDDINMFCISEETPATSIRVDSIECVSKDYIKVTGTNPLTIPNDGFNKDPISTVQVIKDNIVYVVYCEKNAYFYKDKQQIFFQTKSTTNEAIAAVGDYILTEHGIEKRVTKLDNSFEYEIVPIDEPYIEEDCSKYYDTESTNYYPSTDSYSELFSKDLIEEVYIQSPSEITLLGLERENIELKVDNFKDYDFTIETAKSERVNLTELYKSGLLKVSKCGGFDSAVKLAYGLPCEPQNKKGLYLHFIVRWSNDTNQPITLMTDPYNSLKTLKLKKTKLRYVLDEQNYVVSVNTEKDSSEKVIEEWNQTLPEYLKTVKIDEQTNKYLVQRLVAKYWSFLSKKYETFEQLVCEEGTKETIYNTCPGICSEPTYNYIYNKETHQYEGSQVDSLPNCCGSICKTRQLEAVTCKVIASTVSISTLYRLVLQKKYEFFNEPECRNNYMIGELNATEYAHCVYDRFIDLVANVESGDIDNYAKTLFENVEAKTSVETQQSISDSGESVDVSLITTDTSVSNTIVSTPQSMDVDKFTFKVQNILNSQNDDQNQETVTRPGQRINKKKGTKLPPRLKFTKTAGVRTTKRSEEVDLPMLELDDGNAFLVGDGITIATDNYIDDDFVVCAEVNEFCTINLNDDEEYQLLFLTEGANEENDIIALNIMEEPEYLKDSSSSVKKVCNRVNEPGTLYPIIFKQDDTDNVDGKSSLSAIIITVVCVLIGLVLICAVVVVAIVLAKKYQRKKRSEIINNAFQEDSISDL